MADNQKHICKPQKYDHQILKLKKYETKILKPKNDYVLFYENEKERLVIYHPNDKRLCYKYCYDKARKHFLCQPCQTKKTYINAKIQQDSDGNEFCLTYQKMHLCKPIKISTIIKPDTVVLEKSGLSFQEEPKKTKKCDESRIVRKPNFELQRNTLGVPERKLIVFFGDDKNFCYIYRYDKSHNSFSCRECNITAKVQTDAENNGEKYIILSMNKHSCKPVKYEPEINVRIIEDSNFMIFNREDESKLAKLVIFTSETKELCYEYTFINRNKSFRCVGCYALKKDVSAKVMKDSDEKEYLQLSRIDHLCEPKKFILEEFQPKNVPESEFKLCSNRCGKPNSKLIIFDPLKVGFVYEYMLISKNLFNCNNCIKKKVRTVTAKLYVKGNGKKYAELSSTEHVCESTKYDPKKLLEKKTIFENFVVQHNNSGIPKSKLTVFNDKDKNLGYQYTWIQNNNTFYCCGCMFLRKTIIAKLLIDENGKEYVEFGKQQHICSPLIFKEKNMIFEDYKLEENENILITNGLKRGTYKFKFDEKLDAFCCIKCKEQKEKFITATICKRDGGKEFVFLNDTHYCGFLI